MPEIATKGDQSDKHGACSTFETVSKEGSPDVFCEGKPAHRVGDGWADHPCQCGASPPHPPHIKSTTTAGSKTVFINKKAAARNGDDISCGGKIEQCACTTVFAGG